MSDIEIINLVIRCPVYHCSAIKDSITEMIGHLLVKHGIVVNAKSLRVSDRAIRYDEVSERDLEFGYYPLKQIKELHKQRSKA